MNSKQSFVLVKSIKDKVVVITGASSGVGRAMATEFARQGAQLVVAARREHALNELVKECEELGVKVLAVPTDVTHIEAMKRLAKKAVDFGGRIDVWINNAGVLAAGKFEETPAEIHDQVIRTNLSGYLHGAHAVLPHFKQQGHGILINNISVGGWFPTPYAVGYSASKFGLRGFSEALRGELRGWAKIYVCDLFPGFLDTPGMQHAANYTGHMLQPAPPIYDPMRVARGAVALAAAPQSAKTVGSAAMFLRLAHFFFPALSRNITGQVIKTYLHQADRTDPSSGNLFEPVEYGTSIHGGWNLLMKSKEKKLAKKLFLAGIAVGFLIMRQASK